MSAPDKRIRLILWWLLYRVPIDVDIQDNSLWRLHARKHLKLGKEWLRDIEARAPYHWKRMLEKRARRLEYAKAHGGYCLEGWTPPAPGEPIRNAPIHTLALRHPLGIYGVVCEHREGRELNSMARDDIKQSRSSDTSDTASRARTRASRTAGTPMSTVSRQVARARSQAPRSNWQSASAWQSRP
jgi:hypothetical protein